QIGQFGVVCGLAAGNCRETSGTVGCSGPTGAVGARAWSRPVDGCYRALYVGCRRCWSLVAAPHCRSCRGCAAICPAAHGPYNAGVPPGEEAPFELGTDGPTSILAGVDGSTTSTRAGWYAAGLARRQRARVTAVYVARCRRGWRGPAPPPGRGAPPRGAESRAP